MTKTLHLYEPHFLSLLEEAMTHPQRLMATAVLEPHMGEGHDPGLGGCTGGYNFSLSCGCLVQVGGGCGVGGDGGISRGAVKTMRGGGVNETGSFHGVLTKGSGSSGPEAGMGRSIAAWSR